MTRNSKEILEMTDSQVYSRYLYCVDIICTELGTDIAEEFEQMILTRYIRSRKDFTTDYIDEIKTYGDD
tara:strand:- start:1609 stop:1815 length:207 start_codon:yes stop_codon:yes gene_type:complete